MGDSSQEYEAGIGEESIIRLSMGRVVYAFVILKNSRCRMNGGIIVSADRQEIIEKIKSMPESEVIWLMEYIKNREKHIRDKEKREAFETVMKLSKKVDISDDYKEDLAKSLREKYESLS